VLSVKSFSIAKSNDSSLIRDWSHKASEPQSDKIIVNIEDEIGGLERWLRFELTHILIKCADNANTHAIARGYGPG